MDVQQDILALRKALGLSRSELARFLGVSEATVVRWESTDGRATEPKGLQAVLIRAIADAATMHPAKKIAQLVRSCGVNHGSALEQLLSASR